MRLQLFMSRKKMTSQLSVNDWLDVKRKFVTNDIENGMRIYLCLVYCKMLPRCLNIYHFYFIFCASFNSYIHNCKRQFFFLFLALCFLRTFSFFVNASRHSFFISSVPCMLYFWVSLWWTLILIMNLVNFSLSNK